MGQYYRMVVLSNRKKNYPNKDKVVASLNTWDFSQGAKLMEFSWLKNDWLGAIESLINKENGKYAGYPVIMAGDYADEEPYTYKKEKVNLYNLAYEQRESKELKPEDIGYKEGMHHYRYIINEDKKQFFDTERVKPNKEGWHIHPLPLLIADGNNRGGGDYHEDQVNCRRVGTWKRNVVVVSDNKPDDTYKEIFINWIEEW